MSRLTDWLFGWDEVGSIQRVHVALNAAWATSERGPFWLALACLVVVALVVFFYTRRQRCKSSTVRWLLVATRSLLLVLLMVTLAEPVLKVTSVFEEPATLFVVFDGTASMQIRDRYDPEAARRLALATGLTKDVNSSQVLPTRMDYVQAWLEQDAGNALVRLQDATSCRTHVFTFDGRTASNVRELGSGRYSTDSFPAREVSRELTATGQVTALGSVFRQLAQHPGRRALAGIVLISDFAQNSGEAPAVKSGAQVESPVESLNVPIFAVGVGAVSSRDVAIELLTEPKIRRGEKTVLRIRLHQSDLKEKQVTVVVRARALASADQDWQPIAQQRIRLSEPSQVIEVPYVPAWHGDVEVSAAVEVLPGEIVVENNTANKRIQVIDDFVRLLYVTDEPTWEWRFCKEVLHRDSAIGTRGFRTYLASSDPRVRQSNPLFETTLAADRATLFANDVVVLDDVGQATLPDRFCTMLEEFVGKMGGGLVVFAGPRNGLRGLAGTPIEGMLPVRIDPNAMLQDTQDFQLHRLPRSKDYAFMQLGDSSEETDHAWQKLGRLPWYQPVAGIDERAIVLADYPRDQCRDGKTPQPLIAVRRYGNGEVVYLGFNEMWRLRRGTGEKYYRRFWLPVIDRLALSHALGPEKRFVMQVGRDCYSIDQDVVVTVQAYDNHYEPLAGDAVAGGSLQGELIGPNQAGDRDDKRSLRIGSVRPGLFEVRFPVREAGRYDIRIRDPLTGTFHERSFDVMGLSSEMSLGTLDTVTQRQLVAASGGHAYMLEDGGRLFEDVHLTTHRETRRQDHPLWTTPLWFIVIVALMLGEWGLRKWVRLS